MIYILFLFFLSCSNNIELEKGSSWRLNKLNPKLTKLISIEWKVGLKKEVMISKGFQFNLDFPSLSSSDYSDLQQNYGIDSWIFKIEKVSGPIPRNIGFFNIPLEKINRNMNETSVKIYYPAAAMGESYRRVSCPKFNHRLKITSLQLNNNNQSESLPIKEGYNFATKQYNPSNFPLSYSGDHQLRGKFVISYALYGVRTKKIYSSFKPFSQTISVASEQTIVIDSCYGIESNIKEIKSKFNIKDLEIK